MPRVRVVKVPYVEDKTTQGGLNMPSEADVSRMIRAEVDSWHPRRGPDWPGILMRRAAAALSPLVVYMAARARLVAILIVAFIVGSALQIGALGPQPVQVHVPH